jgi:hypothetical protein
MRDSDQPLLRIAIAGKRTHGGLAELQAGRRELLQRWSLMVYQRSAKMRRQSFSSVWQRAEGLHLANVLFPATPMRARVLAAGADQPNHEPDEQTLVWLRGYAGHWCLSVPIRSESASGICLGAT